MEIYIIRRTDVQAHEGWADVTAVFLDKEKAEEACELLNKDEVARQKKQWGERWRSFADDYEVETWDVDNDPQEVLAQVMKERR